jgi:hypothetical protein
LRSRILTKGVTHHFLEQLKERANKSSYFRSLGTIDCHVGIKSGSDVFSLKFESFSCEEIKVWEEDRLRELDFYFEMKHKEWQDWFYLLLEDNIAEDRLGLNEMDLNHPDGVLRCSDELGRLKFLRYMNSLQEFFNCVDSSDFK